MSAPYRIVRFVDAPSTSANVRYDVESYPKRVIEKGSWSDDPPELLGDPEGSGMELGRRRVAFTQVVIGSYTDASAARTALAREVARGDNWLMVQRNNTSPVVFYRCFPTSPGRAVVLEDDGDETTDVWSLQVQIECEPHLRGGLIEAEVTINNDPTQTNGIAVTLPDIEGDAPAPLSVSFTPSSAATPTFVTSALTSWPGLVHLQAEDGTLGTTTAVYADATASGGNSARIETTDANEYLRVSFAPVLPQAGTYRLLVRARCGASSVSGALRGAGDSAVRPKTAIVSGTAWSWYDIGVFGFPVRNAPMSAPYTLGAGDVELWLARVAENLFVHIDNVVAVPVKVFEGRSRFLNLPTIGAGYLAVVDAETDTLSLTSSGVLVDGATSAPTGVFMRVSPGVTNVVHYFGRSGATLGTTQTLTFSYHPRYLWVP